MNIFSNSYKYFKLLILMPATLSFFAGCTSEVDIVDSSLSSFQIDSFSEPRSKAYINYEAFQVSWPETPYATSTPFFESYVVYLFEKENCKGSPIDARFQKETTYSLEGKVQDGKTYSVGVALQKTDKTLGPLVCTESISFDQSDPVVTLQILDPLPSKKNTLTLSGTCSDNLEFDEVIKVCIKNNCNNESDFDQSINCINGSYNQTLSVLEGTFNVAARFQDRAGNLATASITNVIVDRTPPSVPVFTSHVGAINIASSSFNFTWSASDIGDSGLKSTDTFLVSFFDNGTCSSPAQLSLHQTNTNYLATGLVDGNTYSIGVFVEDEAGNLRPQTCSPAVSVSSAAPTLTLTDSSNTIPANQNSYASTQSISTTITNDGAATAWCLSETQNTQPLASSCSGSGWLGARPTSFNLSAGDGLKTVYLWIKDPIDNIIGAQQSIVLDTTFPLLAISSPAPLTAAPNGITISGNCEVGLNINVGGDITNSNSISCSGGGTFSYPVTFTAGEGAKWVSVQQIDLASNTSGNMRSYIKDSIAPTLAFSFPAANTEAQTGVTIAGSCETGITINLSGDLTAPTTTTCTAGTFSQAITFMAGEGTKNIVVSQTDAAGNSGSSNRDFIKDTIAPVLAFSSPAANTEAQTGVTIAGSCETGITINLSGDLTTPASTTCTAGTFSQAITFTAGEGTKNIVITQTDAAGNSGSANRDFIKDTIAPTLAFSSPAANTEAQTGVTIAGSCETGITINFSGDLTAPTTTTCTAGTFSQAITFTAGEGTKNIVISQTDAAGNSGSANRDFIKDTIAPTLAFSSPAANTEAQTGVTIAGSCETGITINLSGDLTIPATTTCTASTFSQAITFTAGEGTKNIVISQTDAAGNSGSANRDFIRDNTAPVLSFSSPAANSHHQAGATISGACENGITVNLSGSGLASPATTSCIGSTFSESIVFTLSEGTKTITISQTDPAGNNTTQSRAFIKDITPPAPTINNPAINTQAQSSVTMDGTCETGLNISFSGTGLLSPFSITCPAGTYSQQVFFSAGEGTKNIVVSQTDAAGNTGSSNRDFIRDNTNPVITQTNLSFPYYSNTDTVTFGGACETGLPIQIVEGANNSSTTCTAGTWSYATPTKSSDSTYNYSFTQTDAAGNTSSTSGRYIRDTVAPSLTLTSSASQTTASDTVTLTGTCEAGLPSPIAVSNTDTSTATCSSGNWSYTTATQTTDASRDYDFTLTDQAGNSTQVSATWERNTQVPNLLITSDAEVINSTNDASFSGNCETGLNIEIRLSGVLENTIGCPAGTFNYTVDTQTTDGLRSYQFRQTNALMLSTNQVGVWKRDTQAPSFTATTFRINNNDVNTIKPQVEIDFTATDSLTNITHFCLKTDDQTDPLDGDACWVAVDSPAVGLTPSTTLALNNHSYNLPIVPETYSVYGWVKDQASNISSLTSGGLGTAGRDTDDIIYTQVFAPVVHEVIVGSNDYPANPPSESDLTVGVGQPLYIKWNATDDDPFPAGNVSIYFTTDDENYTLITSGLNNGQNGSCTIDHASTPADDNATGCYYWSAVPASGYMAIRVVVEDSIGLSSGFSSVGLNVASNIRFIAGNTDPGLNLSAKSAIFMSYRLDHFYSPDPHSLVVARDGRLFFKDKDRGILVIDPADGLQKVFLPQTGVSSGDGGPVSSATTQKIVKIALDFNTPNQRMWIYDYDRIRRIDLTTGVIETVIGGGATNADTINGALTAQLAYFTNNMEGYHGFVPFFALPNGDFIFMGGDVDNYHHPYIEDGNPRLRHYHAGTDQITSWRAGSLTSSDEVASGNFSECSYRGFGFLYDSSSNFTERIVHLRTEPSWNRCNTYGVRGLYINMDANGDSLASHPIQPAQWQYDRGRFTQGMDGKLYFFNKANHGNGIWRYEPGTKTFTMLLGNDGDPGQCTDGTLATACSAKVSDLFVSENGTIYFYDMGLIRTITPSNTVLTLFGERIFSENNTPVLRARLGTKLNFFHQRNDGGITFSSSMDHQFFEFENTGNILLVAGDGSFGTPDLAVDADQTGLNLEWVHGNGDDFGMDPSTGDIYHHAGRYGIYRMTRFTSDLGSTGQWEHWTGDSGSVHWANPSANGTANGDFGYDCNYALNSGTYQTWGCWFGPQVGGFGGGEVLVHNNELSRRLSDRAEVPRNSMIKLLDVSTKVQTHLVGVTGENSHNSVCANGTPLSNCNFMSADRDRMNQPYYDAPNDRWLAARQGTNRIYAMSPGGNMVYLVDLPESQISFTYRKDGPTEYIYYCNGSGRLKKYNLNTSSDSSLSWPISSMSCIGRGLIWDNSRSRLIFPYMRNGLAGFAEYLD